MLKDIDYIIWTGDLPAHDIWNQTKEENLSILKETVAQLLKMFPGIPIFPALGNHEAVPVNRYQLTYNILASQVLNLLTTIKLSAFLRLRWSTPLNMASTGCTANWTHSGDVGYQVPSAEPSNVARSIAY